MSLTLDYGTEPPGVAAMSRDGRMLFDAGIDISNEDWCELVKYQLTNSDLVVNDPRMKLVYALGISHRIVTGYNGPGSRRIVLG